MALTQQQVDKIKNAFYALPQSKQKSLLSNPSDFAAWVHDDVLSTPLQKFWRELNKSYNEAKFHAEFDKAAEEGDWWGMLNAIADYVDGADITDFFPF